MTPESVHPDVSHCTTGFFVRPANSGVHTPENTIRCRTSLSPGAQSAPKSCGSEANLASSPDTGTTAVASGLLSLTFESVYASLACQLCEYRFLNSTVRPLYLESAVLWNSITRANFEKGLSLRQWMTVAGPSPWMGTTTLAGVPMLTSVERGRSFPLTKR